MPALAAYVGAAAEIAGCFAFGAWLRLGRSAWWLAPGMVSLALFAFLLTRVTRLTRTIQRRRTSLAAIASQPSRRDRKDVLAQPRSVAH
jgi:hypothetical protein